MFAFDTWIKKHHPELLLQFNKLPKARKIQTFYQWIKDTQPDVLLKEWPAAASIRTRHLMREVENE